METADHLTEAVVNTFKNNSNTDINVEVSVEPNSIVVFRDVERKSWADF